MNRFLTAIAGVIALSVIQGCSQLPAQLPKVNEEKIMTTSHAHHHTETTQAHNHHSTHNASHAAISRSATATLKTSDRIIPNTPTSLLINVQDQEGRAIADFDTFQEKLMHLIVVSDDLQVFQHLHPTYQGDGQFAVETRLPKAGSYSLFSDYQPTGQNEQVSVLQAQVVGDEVVTPEVDWSRAKTYGETTVEFAATQPTIRVGEEVTLKFDLQDRTSEQPVEDLQPYLGEKGHLVILRQSPTLSQKDYIHAHALQDTAPNQIHFATLFPQPGNYKLWGQFNRNGEIITADFWVKVVD